MLVGAVRSRQPHSSLSHPSMADSGSGNLTSPLLDARISTDVVLDVDGALGEAVNGFRRRRPEPASSSSAVVRANPFEFLGAPPLELPTMSPIDPFRNNTPTMGGLYGWLKVVVCLPIALLRLALFGISITVGYLATLAALSGWKDKDNPMPRWRCRVMWVTRVCARLILFSFGYQWINRKGKPASREIAPIVVSNHISYIDPIYFFYELFPTIVSSESHDALPFVGTIIRAMQVIYVDRFSPQSRKNAVHEIKRKASLNGFPRVLLFPEGTTANGRFLLSFRLGAFIPGLPIQPVIVRYPHVHFDQSWGDVPLMQLMFKMFTQFHNYMEVEYLPVVFPPLDKHHNAVQFAEKTSYAMANALNVAQTSHSYGDMLLFTRASEIAKGKCSNYLVEMAWVESSFEISPSDAMVLLDQYLATNPDTDGRVHADDFMNAFGLGSNLLTDKVFGFLDLEKKGSITFRQFLTGSAHIRRQPLFLRACEAAFVKCGSRDPGYVSMKQIGYVVQSKVSIVDEEQFQKLFNPDRDGIVARHGFMECLSKNPLLIAFFAAL